jgi:hypothetical protein
MYENRNRTNKSTGCLFLAPVIITLNNGDIIQ